MAKAKKSAKADQASKGGEKKKAEAPTAPAAPMIDTNLAAAAAAKRIVHKQDTANATTSKAGESDSFKQLKENLHKPSATGAATGFLQNLSPGKKFAQSSHRGGRQVGHNQTFGADVNRTGVPRRTGG